MRNVWESVVSEAWRGSPFILAGHTMQPDRFLNRIPIGYFFFLEASELNIIQSKPFAESSSVLYWNLISRKMESDQGYRCRVT